MQDTGSFLLGVSQGRSWQVAGVSGPEVKGPIRVYTPS